MRLSISIILALSLSGCAFEHTFRGRLFTGPYEARQSQAEADALAQAIALLKAGRPDAEILAALETRGLASAEARRILMLAASALTPTK